MLFTACKHNEEKCELQTLPVHEMTEKGRGSLRVVLAIVTLVAFALGYDAHYRTIRQRAMAAAEDAGGSTTTTESSGPDWLIKLVGVEHFLRIDGVHCRFDKTTDDYLEILARIPELRRISTNLVPFGFKSVALRLDGGGKMSGIRREVSPLVSERYKTGVLNSSRVRLDLRSSHGM